MYSQIIHLVEKDFNDFDQILQIHAGSGAISEKQQ